MNTNSDSTNFDIQCLQITFQPSLPKEALLQLKKEMPLDEGLRSILYMYCCACHSVHPLNRHNLAMRSIFLEDECFERLISALGDLKTVYKKFYLHVYSCPTCGGDDPRMSFREIP